MEEQGRLSLDLPGADADGGGDAARSGPLGRLLDRNFLRYASYVICERAIPDLSDGLKPVQRRILHALWEKDDGRFHKVANIVGHCMQYHPHGDASITDALVHLANKEYLIERQGNFGNLLTGDRPAASRYIECRLTPLAREEIFAPDLTETVPTYDGRSREPAALPAKLPLLLLLGAEGIAVGLSTRLFPHNFTEVLRAQRACLLAKPFDLAPDFPQGGLCDASEYDRGRGRLRVRARIEIRDPRTLLITELPFGRTTEQLIASIEDAARKDKVPVRAVRDYTAEAVAVELGLAKDADPERARDALYAFTACETAYSGRAVVIRDGRPVETDVHEILRASADRLVDLLGRELAHERSLLLDRVHAAVLARLFVERRLYRSVEKASSYEAMVKAVRRALEPYRDRLERKVTRRDAETLLSMKIRRLSAFDLERNREETAKARARLAEVEAGLADVRACAVRYLDGLLRRHAGRFPRRTEIAVFRDIEPRALTARECAIGYDREAGYLGTDIGGEPLLTCSSLDRLLLVWEDGRYRVTDPPGKFYAGPGLVYAGRAEPDRVLTAVYAEDFLGFTYLKRFTLGNAAKNRDLSLAPDGTRLILFADHDPPHLYARYRKKKGLRIRQQRFHTADVEVRTPRAQGVQMLTKTVEALSADKPSWWRDDETSPRGRVLAL